jgi:hypothetical protein
VKPGGEQAGAGGRGERAAGVATAGTARGAKPGAGVDGARADRQRPLQSEQRHRQQGDRERCRRVSPQLGRGLKLVAGEVDVEAKPCGTGLRPVDDRGRRSDGEQRQGERGQRGIATAGQQPRHPQRRGTGKCQRRQRLDQQIARDERQAERAQPADGAGHRFKVDVCGGPQGEQVGDGAVIGDRPRPREVLQLVGAEHAVGADQTVGTRPPGVGGACLQDEQHHGEEGPRRKGRRRQRGERSSAH